MSAESSPGRRAGRAIRGAVNRALAGTWRRLFALTARSPRGPSPPEMVTGTGPVVVVAPHPDDEAAGCAGVVRLHLEAADPVTVVVVTDGRRSTALRQSPDDTARVRRGEAEAAAAVLGVTDLVWLGLPEGGWSRGEGVAALGGVLARLAPAVVYAPSRVDFHPEHRAVAAALAEALADLDPAVRVYPIQVPLTALLADLAVDVSAFEAEIVAALRAHRSQWGSLRSCLRRRRYAGAEHGVSGLVEELWSLNAAQYAALHQDISEPSSPFRGLRFDAWSDPLAYLTGRSARRRLRAGLQES